MIKFMILGSLLLLAYEDFKYKTVPIWQLVNQFGIHRNFNT